MRVLELLEEVIDICDVSSSVPLTGKIIVEKKDLQDIVAEIRSVLPEEIEQARFIKAERQRIIDDAKNEYATLVTDAENQAEILVGEHEITKRANQRAHEMIEDASARVRELKMSTFDYVDKILYDFQEQMDIINHQNLSKMFDTLNATFEDIGTKLTDNRNEIKELAYKTKVEGDLE
ncbi:MAG: ATPase [Clostridiales Family XIII bacterium]|nr:ATPase [Clostridiales Family XIII bacterium]